MLTITGTAEEIRALLGLSTGELPLTCRINATKAAYPAKEEKQEPEKAETEPEKVKKAETEPEAKPEKPKRGRRPRKYLDVTEMWWLYNSGGMSVRELANMFGVSPMTVHRRLTDYQNNLTE